MVASSLAGNDLASALSANQYEGAPFPGYPADEAVRIARHAEAIPRMTGHLADAAHQLDLCATGCHYVATGITRDLAAAREAVPAQRTTGPALTGAQYDEPGQQAPAEPRSAAAPTATAVAAPKPPAVQRARR